MNCSGRASGGIDLDYLVGGLTVTLDPQSVTPGPRSHIVGVVAALRARGVDTRVFVAAEQPLLRRLPGRRGPAGAARTRGRLRRHARAVAGDAVRLLACGWTLWRVRSWSKTSTADVVYERVAVLQCPGIAHRRRRRRRARYVVESNGIFTRETSADRDALASTRLAARMERMVYRRADLVVAVSANLRTELCAFAGIGDGKVLVLPNAIPDEAFDIVRQDRRDRKEGPLVVGFAGAVVPWQRVDLLIRAVAAVDGDVRVEIVGDGPDLPRLRALVDGLDLAGRVVFCGRLEHGPTLERMAGWDAGFAAHAPTSSASMYHSPLKVYEYAGLGLAIVCTPTPDAEQLAADGARVHFIDADDEASVGRALQEILGQPPPDAATRQQSRDRLRARHSWAARVDVLLERLP